MTTYSLTSSDGVRIVYDVAGEGPALLLLHGSGGGQSRQSWHQTGYVDRLKREYRVITPDIRGHGESDDKPFESAAYSIEKIRQDILSITDACDVQRFALWGFSYGGNIGRYLAARTNRLSKLIIMGVPFGEVGSGRFKQSVEEFSAHWTPLVEDIQRGTLDPADFSIEDQAAWQQMNIPVTLAWLTAMLDWGGNEPADIRCPTLWLSGSENENAITSMKEYENKLGGTNVQPRVVEGIEHVGEFEEIHLVFPILLEFTNN